MFLLRVRETRTPSMSTFTSPPAFGAAWPAKHPASATQPAAVTPRPAAILREVQEDIDVPGGLFPALAQLVSAAARRAEQTDRDGDASCPLHEAAALFTDNAGPRLNWAARALHP
ncbi:hypothetical protein [Streptomyces sp. NBC_01383]|uniref:hypothetical protein n=2 Tax=Streptomyces TaxID=1883 RepID=UPI00386B82D3